MTATAITPLARTIEVYADIACPFTHVGLRRFVATRKKRGSQRRLHIHAWPLEFENGKPLDRELVAREVAALRASVAPDLFKGFENGAWPSTSVPAFGLAAVAYELDERVGEAVSLALRDALFEDGLDIAAPETLEDIGRRFGVLVPDIASSSDAARADWARGHRLGVKGSPHFFVDGRDWFCPGLIIEHDEHGFAIRSAGKRAEEFLAAALNQP
jgi:predicted DsbA family dithiol-disulfide isomerase